MGEDTGNGRERLRKKGEKKGRERERGDKVRTEGGLALSVELRGLGSTVDSKSQFYCM